MTGYAGVALYDEVPLNGQSLTWFGERHSFCLAKYAREVASVDGELLRAVVVSSPGFGRRRWHQDVVQGLHGLQIHFEHHDGMPTPESVARLTARIRAKDPDMVLAIGGGSVMDAAKCAAALARHRCLDDRSVRALCSEAEHQPGIPVLAVPTTPGTGAEATPFATVWDTSAGRKLSFRGPGVRPRGAVLDPTLLTGLAQGQLESCMLDALSQAMEATWSTHSNETSAALAATALRYLQEPLGRGAVGDRGARERAALMLAAHYSGRAIAIAGTTLCHALSYPLTLRHDIPHGYACGLTLASALLFNADVDATDCQDPRGPERVRSAIWQGVSALGFVAPADLARRINEFVKSSVLYPLASRIANSDRIAAEALSYDRAGSNPRKIDPQQAAALVSGCAEHTKG